MATIIGNMVRDENKVTTVTWGPMSQAAGDVGRGAIVGDLIERSVQAIGTNTNTVAIQGSNDGTNWGALGAGITLTIGATNTSPITALPINAKYIRPATPSAGTDTIVIFCGTAAR